jgi:electron transfer flavoprotein alpha subunit
MSKNSTQRHRILVVTEQESGESTPLSLELLNAGRRLADSGGHILCALVLGHEVAALAEEMACYADEVYLLDRKLLSGFQADLYASALEAACRELEPVSLLLGHTYDNLEMAPKVAFRLGSDLITDCLRVERDASTGDLLATKPVYGGNARAVFELDTVPQMVLLRPKVHAPLAKGRSGGKIIPLECEIDMSLMLTESLAIFPNEIANLDQAEVIISAGRGVKNLDGIGELKKLIGTFERYFDRVELGASRPLVDAGFAPRSRLVGQTGHRVAPKLYMAVGISGSLQHVRGMSASGKVVAVNRDREAPIFDMADYGVVGPFEEVIPALIQQLEEWT